MIVVRKLITIRRHTLVSSCFVACLLSWYGCESAPAPTLVSSEFNVIETTINDIHDAMARGQITAQILVETYLTRIATYDKQGPALNAIITINPNALKVAEELDAAYTQSGLTGPLHGIPIIVKDNYDTFDLPTTAGSLSLTTSVPPDDAFQIRKIREAGGIILAKSNMAEFAFSPYQTVGSALAGYTRNPYAPNRVTAGSSGGTAAAVAANFGAVGLGTDTGNSIRGPSSHQNLVGIRSTMGLTSRDGIVPLNLARDIGGPMARTVTDAVIVFDVLAGPDPNDPVTQVSNEYRAANYTDYLNVDGLDGARIGVLRELSDETADDEIIARFNEALASMRQLGATIVDPINLPQDETTVSDDRPRCNRFRFDLNAYLETLGPQAPVKSLADILESDRLHPTIRQRLESAEAITIPPNQQPGCRLQADRDERLRLRIQTVLTDGDLDALVYPTWDNPPRLIGDLNSPHGNNSFQLSPPTGFPAITVPMGSVGIELPSGLQFLGTAWSEPKLIAIAYAFEQGTQHRIAPPIVPVVH